MSYSKVFEKPYDYFSDDDKNKAVYANYLNKQVETFEHLEEYLAGNTEDQTGLPYEYLPKDTKIPTKLSELTEDSTHRLVSDEEKAQWNAGGSVPTDLQEVELFGWTSPLSVRNTIVDRVAHVKVKRKKGKELAFEESTYGAGTYSVYLGDNKSNGQIKIDGYYKTSMQEWAVITKADKTYCIIGSTLYIRNNACATPEAMQNALGYIYYEITEQTYAIDGNEAVQKLDDRVTELEQGGGQGVAVQSVNGKTGVVVLGAEDVGAYELPEDGIPKSDLDMEVQSAIDLAKHGYKLEQDETDGHKLRFSWADGYTDIIIPDNDTQYSVLEPQEGSAKPSLVTAGMIYEWNHKAEPSQLVKQVNRKMPDDTGNITINAEDVGAVSADELTEPSYDEEEEMITLGNLIGGGGSSFHVYSTEEKIVGKWIDGSNIYERVIECVETTPHKNITFEIKLIENVKQVINRSFSYCDEGLKDGAQFFADNHASIVSNWFYSGLIYVNSNHEFIFRIDGNLGTLKLSGIIQYTKTTD